MLRNISTGCRTIDRTLGGGIPDSGISLVYGEAETGKTTLAIQCAVNCARRNLKTLFVDCDDAFSVRRFSQIAPRDFRNIGELLILMKPKDFTEQMIVIDRLIEYINKSFKLVVIDTLTSLYRTEIAEYPRKTFELNREMNRQMACLAQIAKTRRIAVLITSQVRSVFNGALVSIEPVATRVLRFWADTIIALKPTENLQVIRAVLEKNYKKKESSTFHLKIEETGIHEYLTP